MHNIFGYKYDPVTDASNKTGEKLLVLSDIIRYSDAFRILKNCYGDETYKHNLDSDFAKNNPDIIKKYFSDINAIPDRIRDELHL